MKFGRKEEESNRYLQERRIREQQALSKWSKFDLTGKVLKDLATKDERKAQRVAMIVENQERHLKKLNETIISQDFQTTPENVMKVVMIGSALSKRGDIFTEVPLVTLEDAIYFLDKTFETTKRDVTADDKIYESQAIYYQGEEFYKDAVGDGGTNYTVTPDNVPIVPRNMMILLNGALVGYDKDGTGTITVVGSSLTSGTIGSYTTGAVDLVFDSALDSDDDIRVIYHWDSERSALHDEYGRVSLTVNKKNFSARPMPLGFEYTTMMEILLGTTGLGDAEDILMSGVADTMAKAKDFRAIARAVQIAKTNQQYKFNTKFSTEGEYSGKLHAQKLKSVIDDIGGDIYDSLQRGMVNKIVGGQRAITYMKKHDKFDESGAEDPIGVYKAGRLGNMDVYCTPSDTTNSYRLQPDEMLLSFKNPQEGLDVGLAFGVLTELTAKLNYPKFYTEGNLAVVEDDLMITKEFIRLLKLENLPNYNA